MRLSPETVGAHVGKMVRLSSGHGKSGSAQHKMAARLLKVRAKRALVQIKYHHHPEWVPIKALYSWLSGNHPLPKGNGHTSL